MTTRRIPVLIVGGGPVGLALAGELGWRGVPCLLVEQTDGRIVTPKMNEVNVRTMEFCRRWGIAEQVHNCPFPRDHARDAVFVTSFTGYELGRIPRPAMAGLRPEPKSEPKSSKDSSPMRLQTCSQMWFDPILRNFALSHPGVELRHRTRLEAFEDLGDDVTAEIVDLETGRRETIEADYLVGCDGATSAIRGQLGIELTGQGTLGHPVHLFFRAPDFLKRVGKAEGTFFLAIDRGGLWANIRIVDPVNAMWRLMMLDSDGKQTPDSIDKEALIRRAVGRAFDVEWLGCSIWTRRSLVAREYSKGRVFLAGDAVHQLSPTGAMGMNTGIGDVVDLGWKLAAVVQGWGGPKLLASYGTERQPVGVRAIDNTSGFHLSHGKFHDGFAAIEDDTDAGRALRAEVGPELVREVGRMFRTIGLQLGYRYEDSPIIVPDGTPSPPDDPETFVASARPGSRAPHVALKDGGSTLDLYGRGYVLARFGSGAPDGSAIVEVAKTRNVPLRTVTIDDPEAASIYEQPLVLVRPDGHVAWRGRTPPADALALINRVRGA
jgi:2-polyprenyl-6-methoxyphenol hydroxylase-like FAD-dependent oxidoreductase